jgi:hypothetical protein
MKFKVLILALALSLGLSGCGVATAIRNVFHFGERDELYYGATAKQWLSLVEEKATQWQPDAYFYGISEAEVKSDGSSDKWQYLYYSPSSEKTLVFIFNSGFISTKEAILPPLDPIRGFSIDSPTALNNAREKNAKFLENNDKPTIVMSLVGPGYESGSRSHPRWLIKYYGNTGALNVLVDATTGAVL